MNPACVDGIFPKDEVVAITGASSVRGETAVPMLAEHAARQAT